MPPGWPVPHTLMRSSASAHPADDHAIRAQTHGRAHQLGMSWTTPWRVRSGTWSRAAHCSSTVSSSTSTRSPVAAISASRAFAWVLAGTRSTRDQNVLALAHRTHQGPPVQRSSFRPRYNATAGSRPRRGKAKAGPGGAARCPRSVRPSRSSCRRLAAMYLEADVGRDQPDDPFTVRFGQFAHRCTADESRSIHKVRSGLSMISTTSGSSSAAAISGPIAVRSIWMRRSSDVAVKEEAEVLITRAPALRPGWRVVRPHRIGIQLVHHVAHQAAPAQQCRPNCSTCSKRALP